MTAPEGADERTIVPISALEHYSYCPRQCALIHVEQTFEENVFTVRGSIAHERVDTAPASAGKGVRVFRSVPLWSERYGLSGRADVVELHGGQPLPVEYKSGRILAHHAAVQLCAQALCLEEMFSTGVAEGALYSFATRRRQVLRIDALLRDRTVEVMEATRKMLEDQRTPEVANDARCRNCSLASACLPAAVAELRAARQSRRGLFAPLGDEDGSEWFE